MVEQYRGGTFTLYSTRLEIQQAKQLKGGNTAATWFLRGENTCTIKVAATPGGALKKEMVKTLENVRAPDGGLTKVVEKGGKPVMGGLQQSDPFKPDGCRFGDSDCLVAQGADCNTMSAVYAITCNSCKERLEVSPSQLSPASRATWSAGRRRAPPSARALNQCSQYIGQTGRTLHARSVEHKKGVNRGDVKCPLVKHQEQHHTGEYVSFTMDLARRVQGNMSRMIWEGLMIEKKNLLSSSSSVMNSRAEWGRGRLVRINTRVDQF